jgi:hypothetical protein
MGLFGNVSKTFHKASTGMRRQFHKAEDGAQQVFHKIDNAASVVGKSVAPIARKVEVASRKVGNSLE